MSDDLRNDGTSSHKGLDTSPLRDAIARRLAEFYFPDVDWDNPPYHLESWVPGGYGRIADAVLAMPEIVDMLALRRMCGTLTVEQVARALRYARHGLAQRDPINTDDEKAIVAWEDKR